MKFYWILNCWIVELIIRSASISLTMANISWCNLVFIYFIFVIQRWLQNANGTIKYQLNTAVPQYIVSMVIKSNIKNRYKESKWHVEQIEQNIMSEKRNYKRWFILNYLIKNKINIGNVCFKFHKLSCLVYIS